MDALRPPAGDLHRVAAVHFHHVDLPRARARRAESDAAAVGAEGRECIVRRIVCELGYGSAVDALQVQVGVFTVAGAGVYHPAAGGVDRDAGVFALVGVGVLLETRLADRARRAIPPFSAKFSKNIDNAALGLWGFLSRSFVPQDDRRKVRGLGARFGRLGVGHPLRRPGDAHPASIATAARNVAPARAKVRRRELDGRVVIGGTSSCARRPRALGRPVALSGVSTERKARLRRPPAALADTKVIGPRGAGA
jgi:hypothetical protein